MRKTEMDFPPPKYGMMPLSPLPSKAISLPSPSTFRVDVLSPLPESTKEKKADKDVNFNDDDMEVLLAVENEE